MKSTTKVWLIAAVSLVILGLIIIAAVMMMNDWDFNKLSTEQYETNIVPVSEHFRDISIESDTEDIRFMRSEDGKCKVIFYELPEEKHSVTVMDNTLKITAEDREKNWYDSFHIGGFETPTITVYLPVGEYGALSIREETGDVEIPNSFRFTSLDILTSTGDVTTAASTLEKTMIHTSTGEICVDHISADALDLSVSTGKVTVRSVSCAGDFKLHVSTGNAEITNMTCKNFTSDGSTGKLLMENMIAEGKISIERSTGDIRFEKCDAEELYIETDTGDVRGSLLSGKVFITDTDTGSVDIPNSKTGGSCEIHTDTGDIHITLP